MKINLFLFAAARIISFNHTGAVSFITWLDKYPADLTGAVIL